MFTYKIKLADKVFKITNRYPDTYQLSADYLTEEPENFDLETTDRDLLYELSQAKKELPAKELSASYFENGTLEATATYRKIADLLLDYNTAVFHGAVVAVGKQAYLFAANSGTGKTTHTDLWLKQFENAYIVNGDKPLLKITESGVTVYGSPWAGKEGYQTNIAVPLSAICLLERDTCNHIKEISFQDAISFLLQQIYRPADKSQLQKVFSFLSQLDGKVKIYKLGCNTQPEAAIISYLGMHP